MTPQLLRDAFALRALKAYVAAEGARVAHESDEAILRQLRAEHDAELLRLLGLSPDSAAAQRYRDALGRLHYVLDDGVARGILEFGLRGGMDGGAGQEYNGEEKLILHRA